VAILLGVTMVFAIAAALVRRTLKAVGLGFADRLLGAAVGAARGLLLGVAAMIAMAAFSPDSERGSGLVENSVLAPYFLGGAHAVSFVVPQHLQDQVTQGRRRLLEKSPQMLKQSSPER